MECYTSLRNIQALLSDWKTPYEREFGVPCKGLVIPFGAMVEHHPISARDLSRLHQFGPKLLPSIFLGYALHAGRIWKGDILVADIEELEEMNASELHARRLNAKEVLTPQRSGNFIFPVAENLRARTASENIHLKPGTARTRRGTRNSSRKNQMNYILQPTSRRRNAG